MLKLAVGYQLSEPDEESFVDLLTPHGDAVDEVFFAWPGHASGRSPVGLAGGRVDGGAFARFESDMRRLRADGRRLDILFNANCYGGDAMSVAHESEVAATENLPGFMPYTCWNYLKAPENWPTILQATWIRPEDIDQYAGCVDLIKLATRLHERPHVVIGAYARRRYSGNVLDLLEPGFSPLLAPNVIDNTRFPDDWFETVSTCDGRCHRCGYCASVLERVRVNLAEV